MLLFEVNYLEQLKLHFERPNKTGFDIAEIILPTYHFTKVMGFTEDEVKLAVEMGANVITLGHRILRTETASLAILSIVMFEIEKD